MKHAETEKLSPDNNRDMKEDWDICCSHTNQHALKYLIQVGMGCSVMAFCMIMIIYDDNVDNKTIYFSTLSGTLGYFLPHPTIQPH